MFSVIFEVAPRKDRFDDYLELAKQLKPILETMDGFVDNERFRSASRDGWLLSHSTWRDEKSLVRWRTLGEHHRVQQRGRDEVLEDYRLRVGDVTADSDGPVQEQRFDATEVSASTVATLSEITGNSAEDATSLLGLAARASAVANADAFTSISEPGRFAVLTSWNDARAAADWQPAVPAGYTLLRHRVVRVVRDYAMYDRREAPQYYPDAGGAVTRHAKPNGAS